nr:hypothetical protein [Tanacetum cinerariifolium]
MRSLSETAATVSTVFGEDDEGGGMMVVGGCESICGEGDGVSNWTSSGIIGEMVRMMFIIYFLGLEVVEKFLDEEMLSIEDEEVSLVDGVLEGALGALEALEMEALVDVMDVDNG